MARKRPCKICRRWFQPHPRAGDRQRVCGEADCQRERHRRTCATWHEANPAYDKKRRLKQAAGLDQAGENSEPLDAVVWPVIEAAIGPAHRTVIEGIARLLLRTERDAVPSERASSIGETNRELNRRSRDAVRPGTPSSTGESGKVPSDGHETQPARDRPDP